MDLKELSQPIAPDTTYFRPYVLNGKKENADVFLVGINPATPISASEKSIEEYVELLEDYNKFMKYYSSVREGNGKPAISRTRMGMNAFTDWLKNQTHCSIIETNVIAYPTPSVKELKKQSKNIIEKGKEVFKSVLFHFEPKLIVVHSRFALKQIIKLLSGHQIEHSDIDMSIPLKELEDRNLVASFKYNNGKEATIVACRHFMYYGKEGESFEQFRQKLLNLIRVSYLS